MATYTPPQVSQYFAHIAFPEPAPDTPRSLALLSALQAHQLAAVPFESLSLHYSRTRLLSLDPEDLFRKIVTGPGGRRGGYCMEDNTFFGCILRSLGFEVLSVGGRVSHETTGRHDGGWAGWSHMVNLVRIDGRRYLVDAGFGGHGPCRPMPLEPETEGGIVREGVAPQQLKLEYKRLPRHTDPEQRVWVYSYRERAGARWIEAYCFTELEFFADDFEVMNLDTMTRRESYFVQTVIAQRFVLEGEYARDRASGRQSEEGDSGAKDPRGTGSEAKDGKEEGSEPVGVMILHHSLIKRRVGDEVKVLAVLESEADRVAALQRYFGITLSAEEQKGIMDLPTELRGRGGESNAGQTPSSVEDGAP